MTTNRLYRLAGAAAVLSALILVLNAARRVDLVPANGLTHGIAPLTLVFGIFALTGIYLWQRRESGTLGLVGYALNAVGVAGVLGIEFVVNFVFPYLDSGQVTALLDGATGTVFLVVSIVFLVGTLTFAAATWLARRLPAGAMMLYAVGFTPVALRGVVPDGVVLAGYVVGAIGTAWLGLVLWNAVSAVRVSQ